MDSMITYYPVSVIIQNTPRLIGGITNTLTVAIIVLNTQSTVSLCGLFDYPFTCFHSRLECIPPCGQYKYPFPCLYYHLEYTSPYEQYNFTCNHYNLKLTVQSRLVDS